MFDLLWKTARIQTCLFHTLVFLYRSDSDRAAGKISLCLQTVNYFQSCKLRLGYIFSAPKGFVFQGVRGKLEAPDFLSYSYDFAAVACIDFRIQSRCYHSSAKKQLPIS